MLKKIKISNSSGIYVPVELDLVRGNYEYNKEYIYKDKVVSPAVIYGLNGSGKTSVLRTFKNLMEIFNTDLTKATVYGMSNEFFGKAETTRIQMNIALEGVEYDYVIEISEKNKIVREELTINNTVPLEEYTYPRILNRENYFLSNLTNLQKLREILSNSKSNKDIETIKQIDALISNEANNKKKIPTNLSFIREMGSENKDEEVTKIYKYLKNISFVSTDKHISSASLTESFGILLEKNNYNIKKVSDLFEEIMPLDFNVDKGLNEEKIYAMYDINGEKYKLDYKTMLSSGTRDFYEMLVAILEMPEGSLLVIDEIEKTFHPDFLKRVIEMLAKRQKVQLITSSYNTSLMRSLRPDQIYFTKKQNNLVKLERLSKMYPKIREIHNIEKLYYGGRFD